MRRRILILFTLYLAVFFVFAYYANDHQKLIAHRGLVSRLHCENTISSFTAAGQNPRFTGIETDVQDTKDGQIMIFHDPTMNKKTDGKGMLNDHSYHYIEHIRYRQGNKLPTLKQYLEVCKKYHKIAFIELKQIRDQRVDRVLQTVAQMHMEKQAVILSSSRIQIMIVRYFNKTIPVYYITYDRPATHSDFYFVRKYHCGIDAQIRYLTYNQVQYAKKHHIPFAVWVARNPYDCLKLLFYHVHTITTQS